MDKKTRIIAIIAAITASILIITSPSGSIVIPKPNTNSTGSEAVQIVASKLQKPWSLAITGDKIFFTEKVGRLRVIDNGVLINQSVADFHVVDTIDSGLLGVAAHPEFAKNHLLYVYYTYKNGDKLWNKILQITESDDKIVDAKTILDKIPGAEFDNGGVIKFGPDGKLYVGTGDATDENSAQDLASLSGKILRINDDGSIPSDNPYPNSLVYSLGHRNPQGLAWGNNGVLYETEEGPTKNDEINIITKGKNYGWPNQECSGTNQFQESLVCYNVSVQPAGIAYYPSGKLDLDNSLILSTLRGNVLYQLITHDNKTTSQKIILDGFGRIRDVGIDSDQNLYVITSNTDGQGFPDKIDDKLLRIVK